MCIGVLLDWCIRYLAYIRVHWQPILLLYVIRLEDQGHVSQYISIAELVFIGLGRLTNQTDELCENE